jgi:hypothetical protein
VNTSALFMTASARGPQLRGAFRLLLLLLALATSARSVSREMEDPLLGLRFDPALVRFETLDTLPCPAAKTADHPPYFVFAQARVDGTRYWVLNHWQPTGGDGAVPAHQEPAFGLVLAHSTKRCEILATPDVMLEANDDLLRSIRAPLLADAADRYRHAFGSDSALLQALQALMGDPGCMRTEPALVEIWISRGLAIPPACGSLKVHEVSDCAADGAADSPGTNEPASHGTAKATVEAFYRQYLAHESSQPQQRPNLRRTDAFDRDIAENLRICEQFSGGVCGFGSNGDVYLSSQEYEFPLSFCSAGVRITEPRTGWVEVELNVYPSLKDPYYHRRIAYSLVREHEHWAVDDIFYAGVSTRQRMREENAANLDLEP